MLPNVSITRPPSLARPDTLIITKLAIFAPLTTAEGGSARRGVRCGQVTSLLDAARIQCRDRDRHGDIHVSIPTDHQVQNIYHHQIGRNSFAEVEMIAWLSVLMTKFEH